MSFVSPFVLGIVVGTAALGCGGSKDRPSFKPEHMPPSASPLVLGTSTEADVLAKLGPAKPADADGRAREVSPGRFNEHAGTFIKEPGVGELHLWAMGADATPKLGRFELKQDGACDWLKTKIGALDGATSCPGNRKTGVSGDHGYYCLSMDDGRLVHAECRGPSITFWIGKKP